MQKFILTPSLALLLFLTACSAIEPKPFVPSTGHIDAEIQPAGEIPELVTQTPTLPAPAPAVELEKYTVVVNEVPVKELLFALARDAEVNVDIDPKIEGVVTINAIDQTLAQILGRIARQVDLRYEFDRDNLIVAPDTPYFETYNIGYLNLSRETTGSVTVSTQIASASSGGESGSGGGNTSTTIIKSESDHNFWENLEKSITAMVGASDDEDSLIINPEAGLLTVEATARQHAEIQKFVDKVLDSVRRQVLIQATIVEVDLSDQYQAGIDWSVIDLGQAGFSVASTLLNTASITGGFAELPGLAGPPVTTSGGLVLDYLDQDASGDQVHAAVGLLSQFGNARVLSSPQIMVLNNHTAVLKVVENFVYFEIEQELEGANNLTGTGAILATTTTARTIPVGLVMTVTPQISADDSVMLNVRPTISSVIRTELDPNPSLLTTVPNRIPVVRVREMESILKVNSNQVAVLGGLMQDVNRDKDRKTPFLGDIPLLGDILFKSKDRESLKSELVIFMRPIVIRDASLKGDLSDYTEYLKPPKEFYTQETGSESE